ncbi:cell division protein FtsL, partial [Pseudoalteromonas rubra]
MKKHQRQPKLFLEICQLLLANKLTFVLLALTLGSALAVVQVT